MPSAVASPAAARPHRAASAFLGALVGPRDAWLPALAVLLAAVAWLALEGRAYPRFEPYQTGDFAKIELYTRLAAEGSQRVGTESRFHIHQPGPSFFYAAAPFYVLAGEDTRAMALASLAWHAFFLLLLLRQASRLAPGTGPVVAALLVAAFVQARGLGVLVSSWNPHAGMLPYGVLMLASARLATGDAAALPVAVLAASVVLQSQLAWLPGVAAPLAAGLGLLVLAPLRRALRIPTLASGRTGRAVALALVVACALWALPIVDELTGEYRNLHRIVALRQEPRAPTPWLESLGPAAAALNLRRDGEPPESAYAWGARNLGYDPRLPPEAKRRYPPASPAQDAWQAVVVALLLVASFVLAARRRAPTAALAIVALVGVAAAPAAVRYMPGRAFPPYLFMWASMVTLAALVCAGIELVALFPRLRSRALAALLLALVPLVLVVDTWRTQPLVVGPRDARSALIEQVTREVQARAAADLPAGRRFSLRVAPYEDQFTALGLILALDKAGLRFTVPPFGSCRVEGRFRPRGDEWAELLVGALPAAPGAVRLGPADGPSFVWQVAWKAPAPPP